MGDSNPSTLRKRSRTWLITRLSMRLKEFETKVNQPTTLDFAQRMMQKLDTLDSEFKVHHFALIDVIDDDELSLKEQETLNEHDDGIAELAVRIKGLISLCTSIPDSNFHKVVSHKFIRISKGKGVSVINEAIGSLPGSPDDVCLLHQHEEQLCDHKKELRDVCDSFLSKGWMSVDELISLQTRLEKDQGSRKMLLSSSHPPDSTPMPGNGKGKGVKLPKIDIPKFDGNM